MEINLKEKLRALRQQKSITQEALANHLGITPQSVGKWERGEGFPDITLLPKIAFYFDVTVDELLCVDQVKVEEAICEYQRQSKICCQNGENQKNLEIWEKAYSEFPKDCRVIEGLMHAINRDAVYPCPKAEAERIIALGEELLQRSTDTRQRENAVQCLCYTYDNIDKEKALYYADMSGTFHITREDLRTTMFDLKNKIERLDTAQNSSGSFIRAIRKFMTMQTLTPIVLQELIDKIEVFPIEGTGKNRTQRLVIHYRFVGCIDLPSIVPKHTYKLDSRQGVAIEYLPSAV